MSTCATCSSSPYRKFRRESPLFFLEHLWKKFCTLEKIAIRPNYAKETKMVSFSGLKIWESNNVMRGTGCTWNAMRRRVMSIHLKSTFSSRPETVNEAEGVFLIDTQLGAFLKSGPCAAAYMKRIFLPFLQATSREMCARLAEDQSIIDRECGSSLVADADRLAREIIGIDEGDDEGGCDDLLPAAPNLRPDDISAEADDVREYILRQGERLWVSRIPMCRGIPGVARLPTKRSRRGGSRPTSRTEKMATYVEMGYFRVVGKECFPIIPTVAPFPTDRVGRLGGFVELPDVAALQRLVADSITSQNIGLLRRMWAAIKDAGAASFPADDFADHVAALDRAGSAPIELLQAARAAKGVLHVSYEYKSPFGGRRYAREQFSAQRMSREMREVAFGSTTIEIDMRNAFPSAMAQIVAKTCGQTYAEKHVPALLRLATDRDSMAAQVAGWMEGSQRHGKELMLRLLHGGATRGFFRGEPQ